MDCLLRENEVGGNGEEDFLACAISGKSSACNETGSFVNFIVAGDVVCYRDLIEDDSIELRPRLQLLDGEGSVLHGALRMPLCKAVLAPKAEFKARLTNELSRGFVSSRDESLPRYSSKDFKVWALTHLT